MKDLGPIPEPSPVPGVTRRRMLTSGGVRLLAAYAVGCASRTAVSVPAAGVSASPRTAAKAARVQAIENVRKPVFVPESGAMDPVSFSLDLEVEQASVRSLNQAIELSRSHGDNGSRHLLEEILTDSEDHANWLEAQLTLLQQVGEALYLAEQIKES